MRRVMVRYKVNAGRAAENEGHIGRVFEQLAREKPEGVRCEEPPSTTHLREMVGCYRLFGE